MEIDKEELGKDNYNKIHNNTKRNTGKKNSYVNLSSKNTTAAAKNTDNYKLTSTPTQVPPTELFTLASTKPHRQMTQIQNSPYDSPTTVDITATQVATNDASSTP
jgi:hypothetical protein